ncbi:MAG: patatin family protein [Bowdeniella nasicola]|nr:patatin family protein [Bowdeniella nasicola]
MIASHDVALIFEGGGMRGAYSAGMVRALLEAGVDFPLTCGISAGSSLTCNYVARAPDRARQAFVDIALDPHIGNVWTFLRGQGLFHSEYLYRDIPRQDGPFPARWQEFVANPADVRIAAFDIERGENTWWSKADIHDVEGLLTRVQASSSMPGLMPITEIDGRKYVDGALGGMGGIGLDAAQAAGYQKFVVILTQERDYVKRPQRYLSAIRAAFRRYPAVAAALADRHRRYNACRARLFELEAAGAAYLFIPERMPISNGERNYRKLLATYYAGLGQARREIPAIVEFLTH